MHGKKKHSESVLLVAIKPNGDHPENQRHATEGEQLRMSVSITFSNPKLFGTYVDGKSYYVDISPADP